MVIAAMKLKDTYSIAEKAMALHSSTLAWKIPWTEEPEGKGQLNAMWPPRWGPGAEKDTRGKLRKAEERVEFTVL